MATRIEKNTKKLVEKKLDALFALQQELNGNAGSKPGDGLPKAQGGFNNAPGGYTQRPLNWRNGVQGFGQDSYMTDFGLDPLKNVPTFNKMYTGDIPTGASAGIVQPGTSPRDTRPVIYAPPGQGTFSHLNAPQLGKYGTTFGKASPVDNTLRPDKTTPADPNAGKVNWGKVGAFAGQMAPMLYNMAKGLQKPDKVRPNYNPYESQIRSLMANRRYNIEPQLNANMTAQAVSNRNITNVGNSRGELMSNYGASQNYRMGADASAWAMKNNMDNQYMAEQAQMDAGLGANRAQMDWNVQTAQAQNKAATNQFLGQGFNDLGRFSQTQQLMGNQKTRDAQLASLYPDMYSQIYQFQPAMQEIIKATTNKKTF